jgi:hypothetical protein
MFCTAQLQTKSTPEIALRFGSLFFNDLAEAAGKVKGLPELLLVS